MFFFVHLCSRTPLPIVEIFSYAKPHNTSHTNNNSTSVDTVLSSVLYGIVAIAIFWLLCACNHLYTKKRPTKMILAWGTFNWWSRVLVHFYFFLRERYPLLSLVRFCYRGGKKALFFVRQKTFDKNNFNQSLQHDSCTKTTNTMMIWNLCRQHQGIPHMIIVSSFSPLLMMCGLYVMEDNKGAPTKDKRLWSEIE